VAGFGTDHRLLQAQQQRFVVTAAALGLSDRQIATLLALLLGARAPRRATVGRWVLPSARKASLLQQLDARCYSLVLAVCLDEIFYNAAIARDHVPLHRRSRQLRICCNRVLCTRGQP
jgi:hypothetical protein